MFGVTMWKSPTHLLVSSKLTYDCSGFDGVYHLLQGLNVRVLMSKLLLLVVQMASSLKMCKIYKYFKLHKEPFVQVETCITLTMRPFESTIQILLAASSLVTPSLAIAIIIR